MRIIALIVGGDCQPRRVIRATDPDRHFEAITAIGYLLMQLRDLAPDDAAEQWMREDARGPRHAHTEHEEDKMAA